MGFKEILKSPKLYEKLAMYTQAFFWGEDP